MRASIWIAVALMLIGAVMLVADIGAPALWIAGITVGRHRPNSCPPDS